ncbi:hypothetical protein ccbrp13_11040 [Ktedonobacteria bacterium brp13]|nr:hypothetical protein ccbrp13_11040 [Ktedonobacteria bacterium brp13]
MLKTRGLLFIAFHMGSRNADDQSTAVIILRRIAYRRESFEIGKIYTMHRKRNER